ncbi:MAG: T9SS type A sorting domain-containing protein [Balneolales bacterium]
MLVQTWDGQEWQDSERETISFNNGLLDSVLVETMNEEWENLHSYSFSEGNEGVIEISRNWSDGNWVNDNRYTFHDVTLTNYMQTVSELMEQEDLEIKEFSFYLEDSPSTSIENWDGQDWQFEERLMWETNGESSDEKILVFEDYINEHWVPESRMVFKYNDAELANKLEMQEYRGIEWATVFLEEYIYNDSGLRISHIQQFNMNGSFQNIARYDNTWQQVSTSTNRENELPVAHELGNAYPNPFNPATVVPYEMESANHVTIKVYDVTGRVISTLYDGMQAAGTHQVSLDGAQLASGKYIIRMESTGFTQTKGVTLVK